MAGCVPIGGSGTEAFEEEKERLQDFKVNKGNRRQQQQEQEDEA